MYFNTIWYSAAITERLILDLSCDQLSYSDHMINVMWSSYTYCAMSCDPHTHTKITWSMSCDLHIHTQITCVMSNDLHTHTQITWSMSCDLHRHTQITCVMSCDLHTHTQITKLCQFLLLLNIGKDQLRSSHVLAWCSIQLSLLIYTKNLKLILCFNKKISIIFINGFCISWYYTCFPNM